MGLLSYNVRRNANSTAVWGGESAVRNLIDSGYHETGELSTKREESLPLAHFCDPRAAALARACPRGVTYGAMRHTSAILGPHKKK